MAKKQNRDLKKIFGLSASGAVLQAAGTAIDLETYWQFFSKDERQNPEYVRAVLIAAFSHPEAEENIEEFISRLRGEGAGYLADFVIAEQDTTQDKADGIMVHVNAFELGEELDEIEQAVEGLIPGDLDDDDPLLSIRRYFDAVSDQINIIKHRTATLIDDLRAKAVRARGFRDGVEDRAFTTIWLMEAFARAADGGLRDSKLSSTKRAYEALTAQAGFYLTTQQLVDGLLQKERTTVTALRRVLHDRIPPIEQTVREMKRRGP